MSYLLKELENPSNYLETYYTNTENKEKIKSICKDFRRFIKNKEKLSLQYIFCLNTDEEFYEINNIYSSSDLSTFLNVGNKCFTLVEQLCLDYFDFIKKKIENFSTPKYQRQYLSETYELKKELSRKNKIMNYNEFLFINNKKYKIFLSKNKFFNELIKENPKLKKKYNELENLTNQFDEKHIDLDEKMLQKFRKNILYCETFDHIYKEILEELYNCITKYEGFVTRKIRQFYKEMPIFNAKIDEDKNWNGQMQYYRENFFERIELFCDKFATFYFFKEISLKIYRDKIKTDKTLKEFDKICKRLIFLGVIQKNNDEIIFNFFSRFDLWVTHMYKHVCPFTDELRQIREKLTNESLLFENDKLDFKN